MYRRTVYIKILLLYVCVCVFRRTLTSRRKHIVPPDDHKYTCWYLSVYYLSVRPRIILPEYPKTYLTTRRRVFYNAVAAAAAAAGPLGRPPKFSRRFRSCCLNIVCVFVRSLECVRYRSNTPIRGGRSRVSNSKYSLVAQVGSVRTWKIAVECAWD